MNSCVDDWLIEQLGDCPEVQSMHVDYWENFARTPSQPLNSVYLGMVPSDDVRMADLLRPLFSKDDLARCSKIPVHVAVKRLISSNILLQKPRVGGFAFATDDYKNPIDTTTIGSYITA